MAPRDADDPQSSELAVLVVEPKGAAAFVKASVEIVASALALLNPAAAVAVKVVSITGGWIVDRRKYDRVKPILDSIEATIRDLPNDYVRRDEFADLLQETLRRASESPDSDRRETLKRILLGIMADPKDHVSNRRLIRVADELRVDAWKVLRAIETVDPSPDGTNNSSIMTGSTWTPAVAAALETSDEVVHDVVQELIDEKLLVAQAHVSMPLTSGPGCLRGLLTPRGAELMKYARG